MKKKLLVVFFSFLAIVLCIPQISTAASFNWVLFSSDHVGYSSDFIGASEGLGRLYSLGIQDVGSIDPNSLNVWVDWPGHTGTGWEPLKLSLGSRQIYPGVTEYYSWRSWQLDYNWSDYDNLTAHFYVDEFPGLEASVTMQPGMMKTLDFAKPSFEDIGPNGVKISWNAVPEAERYRLRVFKIGQNGMPGDFVWETGNLTGTEYYVADKYFLPEGDYAMGVEARHYQDNQGWVSRSRYYEKIHVGAVPVPSAFLLLGSGILCLFGLGRKR